MSRLNVESSLMFRMLSGRAFLSRGPARANALSSNFVRVLGTSNWFVPADLNRLRPGREDVRVVVSDKYAGLLPLTIPCMRTHSLNRIRYEIGSQWSGLTISPVWTSLVPVTSLAAAFKTRARGASVVGGRPASMALQLLEPCEMGADVVEFVFIRGQKKSLAEVTIYSTRWWKQQCSYEEKTLEAYVVCFTETCYVLLN